MEDLSIIDTSVAEMGEFEAPWTRAYYLYFDIIRDQIAEIISGAHIHCIIPNPRTKILRSYIRHVHEDSNKYEDKDKDNVLIISPRSSQARA